MIKIIDPGPEMIVICNICGCKFSYTKEDIERRRDHLHVHRKSVKCPKCDNWIQI